MYDVRGDVITVREASSGRLVLRARLLGADADKVPTLVGGDPWAALAAALLLYNTRIPGSLVSRALEGERREVFLALARYYYRLWRRYGRRVARRVAAAARGLAEQLP